MHCDEVVLKLQRARRLVLCRCPSPWALDRNIDYTVVTVRPMLS